MSPADLNRMVRGLELLAEDIEEPGDDEERAAMAAQRRRLERSYLRAIAERDRSPQP